MRLKPEFYTPKEGDRFIPWPAGVYISNGDLVAGAGDLSFPVDQDVNIQIHSLHFGRTGTSWKFSSEWDAINGWRTSARPWHTAEPAKEINSKTILEEAIRLVGGDRQRTHGDKLQNHENIARLWNAYLHNANIKRGPVWQLNALDVALMMALLKIARTQLGSHNPDNYVDLAGYAAVAGEIAERTR